MKETYTIITGALGGIGSAFALDCARLGRNLILIDCIPNGEEIIQFIQSRFSIKLLYLNYDLAKEDARSDFFDHINQNQFLINGLINVVGREYEGAFLDRTREEILHQTRLNMEAMVDLTYSSLNNRNPDERFLLVNIASLAGFFPMPYKSLYAATKRFIISFSLGLREEIRDFGNITVLCPSGLPTNAESMRKIFLQGFWGKVTSQETADVVQRTMRKVQRNVPIFVPGLLSKLMVWLASPIPETWLAHFLGRRWSKRQDQLDLWRMLQNNHRH